MSSTSGIYLDCRLICVVSTLARFTFGKELAWCLAVTLTRGQLCQTGT
jgi:predicted component of type VI protein secretion system